MKKTDYDKKGPTPTPAPEEKAPEKPVSEFVGKSVTV